MTSGVLGEGGGGERERERERDGGREGAGGRESEREGERLRLISGLFTEIQYFLYLFNGLSKNHWPFTSGHDI